MKDNNVYIKEDNGRYKPIGVACNKEYLQDGIWYVRHKPGCTSITSVPYMASMFHVKTDPVDLQLLCSMQDVQDKVLQSEEWKELMKRKEGYSLSDVVATVVKVIYDNERQ